jgi:hypothetical protein
VRVPSFDRVRESFEGPLSNEGALRMKTFLHYWLGMVAVMAVMAVFMVPVWVVGTLINRVTSNLYLGTALLTLFISVMVAAFQMWVFSPRNKWLIDRLSQAMFPTNKREGT